MRAEGDDADRCSLLGKDWGEEEQKDQCPCQAQEATVRSRHETTFRFSEFSSANSRSFPGSRSSKLSEVRTRSPRWRLPRPSPPARPDRGSRPLSLGAIGIARCQM